MKNALLRATLLGIVASASFSLTQTASQAATTNVPARSAGASACAALPPNAAANAAAAEAHQSKDAERFTSSGP